MGKLRNKDNKVARAREALTLATAQLEDALTEQYAAQQEATLDTTEHGFVALTPTQPEVRNRTADVHVEQAPEQDDPLLCVVCISNPKTVLLLPCRHMCVCPTCYDSILQVEPLCPLCRAHVETHIEVFM